MDIRSGEQERSKIVAVCLKGRPFTSRHSIASVHQFPNLRHTSRGTGPIHSTPHLNTSHAVHSCLHHGLHVRRKKGAPKPYFRNQTHPWKLESPLSTPMNKTAHRHTVEHYVSAQTSQKEEAQGRERESCARPPRHAQSSRSILNGVTRGQKRKLRGGPCLITLEYGRRRPTRRSQTTLV